MRPIPPLVAAVCCTLPLVLASCGSGDDGADDQQATSSSATSSSATSSSAPTPSGPTTQAPEPGAGSSGPAQVSEVRASEVQGVTLLTYAELLGESPREVTGRLITGPGGCLSLTMRDRPQLLIFPPDTTLTTGRPSVQLSDGTQVYVGDEFTASMTDVPLSVLAGAPEKCLQGPADTAHAIAG